MNDADKLQAILNLALTVVGHRSSPADKDAAIRVLGELQVPFYPEDGIAKEAIERDWLRSAKKVVPHWRTI